MAYIAAVALVLLSGCSSAPLPDQLDEPWPPDAASCLQHSRPDGPVNSSTRLATKGTYTRQAEHTAVLYFCFGRHSSDLEPARITAAGYGCVTHVSPETLDLPGKANELMMVPITISICDRGTGSVSVALGYVGADGASYKVGFSADDVIADDSGVLIKEQRGGGVQ